MKTPIRTALIALPRMTLARMTLARMTLARTTLARTTLASMTLAAVVCAFVAVLPALAQDDDTNAIDDIPHITVIGTAQAEVTPDLATITLGVTSEQPSATAAAAETASKAKAVIDTAKAQGVAAADIATQSLTLTQTFDDLHGPQGQDIGRRPRGFAADNVVAIKVHDLAKAGALAGALIQTGANRFDGISFSVDRPQPILDRLLGEAVKSARAQAEIAAAAAGVRLGRVLLIERPNAGEPQSMAFARVASKPAAMPVEAGTTSLSREIEVTWALDAN